MAFDPYYSWLGIRPEEQPPNYYRLLGLTLFEDNPAVIENAADRQMAHIRTFQSGKNGADSQRLLNEIAAARICLIDPSERAAYSLQLKALRAAELHRSIVPVEPAPATVAAAPSAPVTAPVVTATDSPLAMAGARMGASTRTRKRKRSAGLEIAKVAAGGAAGLLLAVLLLRYVMQIDITGLLPVQAADQQRAVAEAPRPTPDSRGTRQTPAAAIDRSRPAARVKSAPPVAETLQLPESATQSLPASPPAENPRQPEADDRQRLVALRDSELSNDNIIGALNAVAQLAELDSADPLQARLALLLTVRADSPAQQRTVATQLAMLLEQALAQPMQTLMTAHVDRLLVLARMLDDRDLERRATLIAIRLSEKSP